MNKNYTEINKNIKQEADEILIDKGLLSLLSKYGKPYITGSYALNLMTWRDLDIYLESDVTTEPVFFNLGAEIKSILHPVKMNYRNEIKDRTPGLPTGLYWGIYLGNEREGAWKIDIWAMNKKECRHRIAFCDDLLAQINDDAKEMIFEIKSACWKDPEYRRSYTSRDIYEAVLDNKVRSVEEFKELLQAKK